MNLFYATAIHGASIELDSEESRHLAKVLRLKEGEIVHVINGKGSRFECKIISANPKKATLQIINEEKLNENFGLSIAAAPTKNLNRWEWFLEKSTELGVDTIYPLNTFHSERKLLKHERQERILIAAMKQSYKATLPQLIEIEKFERFIQKDYKGQKFIAHCFEHLPRKKLKEVFVQNKPALVLIGPEGDFSESEVKQANDAGYISISLGKSRLRTETAAIVACHSIHLLNE